MPLTDAEKMAFLWERAQDKLLGQAAEHQMDLPTDPIEILLLVAPLSVLVAQGPLAEVMLGMQSELAFIDFCITTAERIAPLKSNPLFPFTGKQINDALLACPNRVEAIQNAMKNAGEWMDKMTEACERLHGKDGHR